MAKGEETTRVAALASEQSSPRLLTRGILTQQFKFDATLQLGLHCSHALSLVHLYIER